MTTGTRYDRLLLAVKLAPSLWRYDLSRESQLDEWASWSFKAADAFIKAGGFVNVSDYDKPADSAIQAMKKGGKE